jgi:hypothetical protein
MAAKRKLSSKELDALHDSGADMSAHLNNRASRRPGLDIQRVNVDFPIWMIESLDQEADRLGVPRQSVIKFWISECLTGRSSKKANQQSSEPTFSSVTTPAKQESRPR